MKVSLIRYTPDPDNLCGEAAVTCTGLTNRLRALQGAIKRGHESIAEHAVFTFEVEGVSRALLAQLTRHRIASFSVQSQRYVDMGDMPAVVPPTIEQDAELKALYHRAMESARECYWHFVQKGVPKEDARYVTPQAACTKLIVTMNARELLHFFELRCCNRAQWEIRALADEMLLLCKSVAPYLFKDGGCACMRGKACPEGKQSCKKPRKRLEEAK